jgi:hypothetical protein
MEKHFFIKEHQALNAAEDATSRSRLNQPGGMKDEKTVASLSVAYCRRSALSGCSTGSIRLSVSRCSGGAA